MRLKHYPLFVLAMKNMLSMAMPIVGSRVAYSISMFVSMLLIAHLGHAELAAGALINSVMFTLLVPIWQLFFATGILVGNNYGAKQFSEIGAIVRHSFILSIILGLPIMLILWYIGTILVILGQNQHLAELTQQYFRAYVWTIIPGLWSLCLNQFLTGIGKQKTALIFTLCSIPMFIGIGFVLMHGKFGISAFGISGMGYANSIVTIIMVIVLIVYLAIKTEFQPYNLITFKAPSAVNYTKKLFVFGWPIAAMFAGELLLFSLATLLVGWLGETELAAWQITVQINLIVIMFPMGIGQAGTILISQSIGRNKYVMVRYLNYAALLLGLICVSIFSAAFLFAPQQLIALYLNANNPANATTVHFAIMLLAIAALMNVFDALRSICACTLRGLHDTILPMLIFVVLGTIISLPIGYWLGFSLHFGVTGIRWGFVIGFLVGAIILLCRSHKFSCPVYLATKFNQCGD